VQGVADPYRQFHRPTHTCQSQERCVCHSDRAEQPHHDRQAKHAVYDSGSVNARSPTKLFINVKRAKILGQTGEGIDVLIGHGTLASPPLHAQRDVVER
jgi:hypothetical protein